MPTNATRDWCIKMGLRSISSLSLGANVFLYKKGFDTDGILSETFGNRQYLGYGAMS